MIILFLFGVIVGILIEYKNLRIMNYEDSSSESKSSPIPKIIGFVILAIIILILVFSSFGTVDAGFRGVVLRLGAVTGETKEPGLYFKLPMITDVEDMNVQVQKEEAESSAASSDLQNVTAKVALNYHLDPNNVTHTYENLRRDYASKVIQPALQNSIKAATAKFTAEQLVTQRNAVSDEMYALLREKLNETASGVLVVDGFNIVNLQFSSAFEDAIERKVTAVQDAEASKNQLEKTKYEAQKNIETAKGEAEAIRVKSISLQQSPQYIDFLKLEVQRQAIDKWDGNVPTTMVPGSTVPFIDLNK